MTFEEWYLEEYGEEVGPNEAEYARKAWEAGRKCLADETLEELKEVRKGLKTALEIMQEAKL